MGAVLTLSVGVDGVVKVCVCVGGGVGGVAGQTEKIRQIVALLVSELKQR